MADPTQLILDAWAPLSHKTPIAEDAGGVQPRLQLAPSWVPPEDRRRLDAYKILHAYRSNVARAYLTRKTPEEQAQHREYGDPSLVVTRVAAGVLGDDPQIVVDGADRELPDQPELPPEPANPGPDATPLQRRIYQLTHTRWEETANSAVDDWEQTWQARPELTQHQTLLRDWAGDELLLSKLVEGENDTCGLGDGVYVLTLSREKARPLLDVYDPGMFFPVRTEWDRGFPSKVHLAWEFEQRQPDGTCKRFVRRLTWELVDVRTTPGSDSQPLDPSPRRYPWAPETDSYQTCLFSDGTWRLEDIAGKYYTDLSDDNATWAATEEGVTAHRLDLRQDWIPVVHVPCTPSSKDGWGQSVLAIVAQILDDLAGADTDTRAAARLASTPAVALAGATAATDLHVRPGAVFGLGERGRMDVLDLTAGLAELRATKDDLRDRFLVNARVPKEVVGVGDITDAASGILLQLAFGPFAELIGELRLTRDPKFALLLKMVQRMYQSLGVLDPGDNPTARIAFGPYLPSDLTALISQVTSLLAAKAISRQTAVQLLVAGGLSITDAHHELERIDADDTLGAVQVAEATASEQLAAERLGLKLPVTAPAAPPEAT